MTAIPAYMIRRLVAFTVPGKPVAWQRAGFAGGQGFYTKPETRAYQKVIKQIAALHWRSTPPVADNAIVLTVTIRRAKPKRKPLPIVPITRPDIDNVAKTISDALNGLIYHDDGQIADLRVRKIWSTDDGVDVTVDAVVDHDTDLEGLGRREGARHANKS